MASSTPANSNTPSVTISTFTPAESSILPYTQGLTGVNLWLNSITSDALYASLGVLAILVVLVRIVQATSTHTRFMATVGLNRDQQRYWTYDDSLGSKIKKNLLVAPLIRKRHNQEISLSTAVNVGTIPSRLHTVFLLFYILTNVGYCCILDYRHQSRPSLLAEARGRTGYLAVMNMLPLFIFSARNNPFIPLLGISFDAFNLFHRWIGRIVVLEALAHTFIWGVNNYDARGLNGLTSHLRKDLFLIYGLISIVSMLTIMIQSVSIIRHAFYESFLHLHQILVVTAIVGLLLHCESQSLPQKPFLYALICLWAFERFIRLCRIFHRRGTTVTIEALRGGACRVTFNVQGKWTKAPGKHLYAYIPSVSLWMSHPFSVAWVERGPTIHSPWRSRTLPLSPAQTLTTHPSQDSEVDLKPLPRKRETAISCIVASRTGMTAALFKKARKFTSGAITLKAFVEGPYGGLENMRSYGTVVLFAGGVGITHQISILHGLVGAFADGTCATRKAVLVWSVREVEQLEWVGQWMDELVNMPRRGNEVKVLLYVTRTSVGESGNGVVFKETGVREEVKFGRMNARDLVWGEFENRVGAMCVGVCGPGGLADDVRMATREVMGLGKVDFWEESFTW